MLSIGQSGPMLVIAIGQPGAQVRAIQAAQFRLERTGCAARRPITNSTTFLSRYFNLSLPKLKTRFLKLCVQSHSTLESTVFYEVYPAPAQAVAGQNHEWYNCYIHAVSLRSTQKLAIEGESAAWHRV